MNQLSDLAALASTLAFLLAVCPFAAGGDRVTGRMFATRSEVIAQHGIAATSHPLATTIALDILKRGGTAIDAAIAANAALGLMEPTGSGIGGDLFAIVWDAKSQKLHALNASGRSPLGLTLDELRTKHALKQMPDFGPLPITVPGCVDGWFELHAKFGKLPMADILKPTVDYARDGFPVSELIAYYWAFGERLREYPGFADTFFPAGRAPRKGELHRNPMLAATLETIGAQGRDAFYKGALADAMDSFCQAHGCCLRKADFAAHTSEWVTPISTNYRGYDVWEIGGNNQGTAVLQMMNILEGFDLRAMGCNSADYLHTMLETKKIVYEDRARLYADAAFFNQPTDKLISKEYAAERRKLIDPKRAKRTIVAGLEGASAERHESTEARRHEGRDEATERRSDKGLASEIQNPKSEIQNQIAAAHEKLRDGDTVYLTVADAAGNMVSLIQSNYRGFGSGLCPTGLGFCFQDRGALFSLEDGHANVYAPGKRPFHTIIPAFVTKYGKPWLSFGVMGGDMQPQGHVQILCNIIDFGMNVQEAGDAARWYHTGSSEPFGPKMTDGGRVSLESGIDDETARRLVQIGHVIQPQVGPYGGFQAILRDPATGVYFGASESRKDGHAAGY
ncbi:MAG: gamma-glutamyltransferase family protein [Phycisphaerae bacterium]